MVTPADAFPVVGVGASAGGLEAFRRLLAALPDNPGIAFVLIPHLDPDYPSMMADLLGAHTPMPVVQAADRMPLEPNRAYVIPPHAYLSVRNGALRLTAPQARHGARLPFDFFLNTLAEAYGERAVCVVLSGTGADGSVGLRAVSERGGLVIAQDPEEAAFDGMPRNAIMTGAVNLVLPVAQIPQALTRYARHPYVVAGAARAAEADEVKALDEIIALLQARTSRDFSHYRRATLLRRIRRRMAATGTEPIAAYVELLHADGHEAELLAKDFLIHVTSFFRDPAAFEALAKMVLPSLIEQADDQPVRVWVPGCSTGEEAYSLAMLLAEEYAVQERPVRLQIFASDIGADALEIARSGIYPERVNADISPQRLQRFFSRQDHGYRVSRELRDMIVFTDHDLLADPPFSRIDLVSCRNLLIYLQPDEQRKVLSLFHFALREGGYLFLGASETIGALTEFFEPVSNLLRIFRRIGHARPRERAFTPDIGERGRGLWPRMALRAERRVPDLAESAQRLLLDAYAPAAVLVDRNYRAQYFWGPTDRYLRVAAGEPSRDALAMLREGMASRFRAAVRQAIRTHEAVTIGGARVKRNGGTVSISISARPLAHDGEELVLVSFADEPERKVAESVETPAEASRAAQLELELEDTRRELESAIRELEDSNQELSAINEEALSVNEEFQSTNEELETSKEELQSLNEELTTTNSQLHEALERERQSSDDLQNILNSSDADTLFLDENLNIRFFTPGVAARFNLIASDVGRPLTDLANPFADIDLISDARSVLVDLATIRREGRTNSGTWYTYRTAPYRTQDNRIGGVVIALTEISSIKAVEQAAEAARVYAQGIIDTVVEPLLVLDEAMRVVSAGRSFYEVFAASPADTVGRCLPDSDARHLDVPALRAFLDELKNREDAARNCEIEIELPTGRRTISVTANQIHDEGVSTKWTLLALNDITQFRRAEQQLASARQTAEQADLLKSRFLAAVSHDLRQPLQTLMMLLGALRNEVTSGERAELLSRAQEALDGMSGLLGALLDINQLEAGAIQPQAVDFSINELLVRLDSEYGMHARAQGLSWRYVPSRLVAHSDPRLLEQMVRNLLSNALRYTEKGKVLLGCRRRGNMARIEVWDTGIGIAEQDISRIFEEHQRADERAPRGGHGLGLTIVKRLGDLLGHAVGVRSQLDKGSVFSIEVPLASQSQSPTRRGGGPTAPAGPPGGPKGGTILVLEDDPAVRRSLEWILAAEGYRAVGAASGKEALALIGDKSARLDLIVSDYFLQDTMNGVEATAAVRRALQADLPVIFVTGDIGHRDVVPAGSILLTKPVKPEELLRVIWQQLATARQAASEPGLAPDVADAPATLYVVDDDRSVREAMRDVLTTAGYRVEAFADGQALLAAGRLAAKGCFLIDVRMPGMSGFDLLARLAATGNRLPAILITGHGDVPMAVEAMRAGAADFIAKPFHAEQLLACIERALRQSAVPEERSAWRAAAAMRIAGLTARERQVMDEVVAGHANKEIAARFNIAQRTVESHRANVMKKMGAASLSDLVRLALAAGV